MRVNGVNNFLTNILLPAREVDRMTHGFRKQGTTVPAKPNDKWFLIFARPVPGAWRLFLEAG
jgi:hypothetical protein